MSITDELREYARRWPCTDYIHKDILAIADRIDAAHERLMQEQPFTVDMVPMTDERMAEHGWIRLPVDAEGVPVRVGDEMESLTGKLFTAEFLTVNKVEWLINVEGWHPRFCHHHCPPTVEDVLREFALRIDAGADIDVTGAEVIAEFAPRLRLADDGEER